MAAASSVLFLKLTCLVLVSMMVIAPKCTKAAITCGQVVNSLTPCINYVANGGAVPPECCNGVSALYNAARTTPDRQTVCKCLKQAISGVPYSGFNLGLAAGLPGKCGVNIPYKISPSTDCNRVQ
ncbi:hypothetical protein ACOSP7_029098 [Xanthoceras sorbifolium]|uniref:Non-specific lipid-transfer protein n=1 Tax=Xanthoceras sorbifolium TaxID=99658 RepID=A0ABQ8HBU9_9ROSI|nr:hypothetical protein JRO89_XS12G0085600 [Xanthoceras sorbifolium]